MSSRMASTPARTAASVSSSRIWSSPAALRSWFQITWNTEPQRTPRAAATVNRVAYSISEASTPSRFHARHFCSSSSDTGIRSGECCP